MVQGAGPGFLGARAFFIAPAEPKVVAKKVLESPDFTRSLREIEEIHAVPLPATDGLSIMEPGFREGIYTFAFE